MFSHRLKLVLSVGVLVFSSGWESLAKANGPENLLLVINTQSDSSVEIANHYIALRQIPMINVVRLDKVPEQEVIDIKTFRQSILEPVLGEILRRKLKDRITMIIYSADFPTAIRLPKDSNKSIKPVEMQKYFRPVASINAATFYASQVLKDDFTFNSPVANFYYRKNAKEVLGNYFEGKARQTYEQLVQAIDSSNWKQALEYAESLLSSPSGDSNPVLQFRAAEALAGLDRKDDSLSRLRSAIQGGWHFSSYTANARAFSKWKTDQDFQNVLETMTEIDCLQPTSFDAKSTWQPSGFKTSEPGKGRKYFLSMMLGVARGRGNSVDEIVDSLKRSVNADGSQPKGTIYFVSNKQVRTKTRAPQMNGAIEALKRIGQPAELISSTLPKKKKDVLGLMMGASKFNWSTSSSTILPGAICDNLTSAGGNIRGEPGTGQTTVAEFVKNGAAGASGTVVEPYTIPHKFPHALIHYYYASGCSLIESFYQSLHGPYQLLIVGDPLCRPFSKELEFTVKGIADQQTVSGKLSIGLEVPGNSPITEYDIYYNEKYVKTVPHNESFSFDTERVPDGYHEFRLVARTDGRIRVSKHKRFEFKIQNHGPLPKLDSVAAKLSASDDLVIQVPNKPGLQLVAQKDGYQLKSKKKTQRSESNDSAIVIPCDQLGCGPVRIRVFVKPNDKLICLGTIETLITKSE